MRLYPSRPIKGQSFEGVKSVVVPNQSMSLREIIRRFIKREALPTEKQGIYAETDYDLEKLSKEDMTVQSDVMDAVKKDVERKKKVAEDMLKAAKESPEPKFGIPMHEDHSTESTKPKKSKPQTASKG